MQIQEDLIIEDEVISETNKNDKDSELMFINSLQKDDFIDNNFDYNDDLEQDIIPKNLSPSLSYSQ